nr:hypothetical protein [Endozoicomonas elysicola]
MPKVKGSIMATPMVAVSPGSEPIMMPPVTPASNSRKMLGCNVLCNP